MLIINKILRFNASFLLLILTMDAMGAPFPNDQAGGLPQVPREFRGLWIATVGNVDWPSKAGLTTREQKEEFIAILDRAVSLHLNVIVLQVRPSCDAMYDSRIEPWSEYLTGQMGRAPSPYYDPVAFAVEECHKRGLELHAWFNPYRARLRESKTPVSRSHVIFTHPGLVRTYGKYLWLDPTEAATREYSFNVIMDVVRRYDIDGVHFDDYFFPYRETAGPNSKVELEFPDDASWRRYLKTGGKMSRNDWRRENVNLFVKEVYDGIKKIKPWVKFGISPFGIWQPKHPPGIAGLNSFDVLYCDSRKWLADGWLDYCAPQLYWPVAQKAQSFPALLNWWTEQNIAHRVVCPGIKVEGWKGVNNEARELTTEIVTTRRQPGASGEILWHSKPIMANRTGIAETLRNGVYSEAALGPAYPWLEKSAPARPVLTLQQRGRQIQMTWAEPSGPVWQWVVRRKTGERWSTEILPGAETREIVTATTRGAPPEIVAVSAVSRCGNMSEAAVFNNP